MVSYDPEADALYVSFRLRSAGDVVRTVEIGDGRQVDYAADGEVLGVEFLAVSEGLNLDGVPHREQVQSAVGALARLPVEAS